MSGKVQVTTLSQAQEWLHGLERGRPGDHHGRIKHATDIDQVYEKVLAELVKTIDAGSLYVHTRLTLAGLHLTNTSDFTVGGRPYTITYTHSAIVIRRGNKSGPIIHSIDNATSPAQIVTIFASL